MQIINYYATNYLIAILLLGFGIFSFSNAFAESANKFSEREIYEGKVVEEVAFLNAQDEKITLSSFKGKTLIINFWATWCGACVEEMASLDKLQKILGDDYLIIAVSEDFKGLEKAREFYENEKIKNLGLYADIRNHLMNSFKVNGLPTTVFVNKDLKEVARIGGYVNWLEPKVKEFINGL